MTRRSVHIQQGVCRLGGASGGTAVAAASPHYEGPAPAFAKGAQGISQVLEFIKEYT